MLQVLPPEIIQLVFNYVPNYHLLKLRGIGPIELYVVQQLYRRVKIGPLVLDDGTKPITLFDDDIALEYNDPDFTPNLPNIKEFVKVCNSYPLYKPYQIELENCMDLIVLNRMFPEKFKNVRFIVSFSKVDELDLEIQRQLISLVKKYNIVGSSFKLQDKCMGSHFKCSSYFLQIIREMHLVNITVTDMCSLDSPCDFWNLHSLTIISPVKTNDLTNLPKNLQELSCNINLTWDTNELAFPPSLKLLKVNIVTIEDIRSVVNLSNLGQLQKLEVLDTSNCTWTFPSSLLELRYNGRPFESLNFNVCCPDLQKLVYYKFPSLHDCSDPIVFPQNLIELETLVDVLDTMIPQDNSDFVQFPNLKSLTIVGNFMSTTTDLGQFKLPNLVCLALCGVKLNGKLPLTVKKLSLIGVPLSEMMDLCYLTNLEVIEGVNLENNSDLGRAYYFPASLRYLALINLNIEEIEIVSKNLVYLCLKGNKINKIDNSHLIIPSSVVELNLSQNEIEDIDLAFNWPDNLQTLTLSQECKTAIPLLPKHICLQRIV